MFHMGMGTWIRNQFGLWHGNQKLFEACGGHPDSASMVIIDAAWRCLREMEGT